MATGGVFGTGPTHGYTAPVRPPTVLAIALVGALTAGCSEPATGPDPAAARTGSSPLVSPQTAPAWTAPSPVADVCARVGTASVAAMLGRRDVQGVARDEGPTTTSLGRGGRVCHFQLPQQATFDVGINPIPMTPAIPGAEQAMRTLLDVGDIDGRQQVSGVGDLALYEPLNAPGAPGIVSFWAVQGKDVHWYGITIWGYDPTPRHDMLGALSQPQLVDLAKRCLNGL